MSDNKHNTGEAGGDREKSLDYSIRDGLAYSLMVGFGEQYIAPYAIRIGAGNMGMASLSAIPNFIGSIFQMVSASLLDRIGKRKVLTMVGAIAQGCVWVPILLTLLLPYPSNLMVLIPMFVVYCSSIHFSTPAWNSMMGDLVPAGRRGRYFGKRNMIIFFGTCVATLAGGMVLHLADGAGWVWWAFALLFALSLLCRMVSCHYLSRMVEPPYTSLPEEERFTMIDFVRRMPSSNFGRFVIYVVLINGAATIAAPFFSLYMLRDLRMSYQEYTVAQLAHAMPMFAAMPLWGWCGDRYGSKKVMQLTGAGLSLIPFLWLLSAETIYLWLIQAYAGFVWAGFNLCANNFIFDSVTTAKRARCFAYFNVLNGTAMLTGGLAGGILSSSLSSSLTLFGVDVVFASEILVIVALSGLLRIVTHLTFIGSFQEVRSVAPMSGGGIFANMENLSLTARKAFEMFSRKDR